METENQYDFNNESESVLQLCRLNHNYPWWVSSVALPYVFPVCLFTSFVFLLLVVAVHLAVPELRQKGGLFLFCHNLALTIKAVVVIVSLTVDVPHKFCKLFAVGNYYFTLCVFIWLSIMCIEAWRNIWLSAKLFRLKSTSPVYYHLIGWGSPAIMSVSVGLVDIYAKGSSIIRPGFGEGTQCQCWFKGSMEQFLYFAAPVGILLFMDVLLMATITKKLKMHTQNSFTLHSNNPAPEPPMCHISSHIAQQNINRVNSEVVDQATQSSDNQIHRKSDYVAEFWLQVKILFLSVLIWAMFIIVSILSWLFQRIEIRIIPGLCVALQGIGFFFIFAFHKSKQRVLRKKFPHIFIKLGKISLIFRNISSSIRSKTERPAAPNTTEHSGYGLSNANQSPNNNLQCHPIDTEYIQSTYL